MSVIMFYLCLYDMDIFIHYTFSLFVPARNRSFTMTSFFVCLLADNENNQLFVRRAVKSVNVLYLHCFFLDL